MFSQSNSNVMIQNCLYLESCFYYKVVLKYLRNTAVEMQDNGQIISFSLPLMKKREGHSSYSNLGALFQH